MKKILFLCLLWMTFSVNAQVITVKDKESQDVLSFVSFKDFENHLYRTTNVKGQIELADFKESTEIHVEILGYQPQVLSYSQLSSLNQQTLYLSPGNITINEVVVTATRSNHTLSDLPIKVATISSQDASLSNSQTAADLLGSSGEVYIQKSQQGGGSPMIRGFSTNRLLYTVDGVRMNTAIFRSGNLQNVISLDPFAIEQTEITFGPGSVMYGSDALGGVMSFRTLTPQLSLTDSVLVSGKAVARMSSANQERTGHFDINVGFNKWALVSSFTSTNYGDLTMGSHGPSEYLRTEYVERINGQDVVVTNPNPQVQTPSGYTQMNLMQKIRFQPNKKWNFEYGFHYSETSSYSRYDRLLRYKNGLPRYGEWYYGPQKWMMHQGTITHQGDNTFYDQMVVRVAHQYFEESRISRNFNDDIRETRLEEVYANSVNVDFDKQLGDKNTLYYGLEYVRNEVYSTGTDEDISTGVITDGASRYPRSNWESYAAYVTNQYQMNEKWMLQAGARYNQYLMNAEFNTAFYPFDFTEASLNDGALTGSVGVSFRPTKKWLFTANLSTGFRSPNIDDMGKVFDSEPGSVVVPNPDLEAEYAYNADLGITKVFGNFLKVNVNGYYTLLDNALVRRDYTLNGQDSMMYDGTMSKIQAIQNAAQANIYGIEAGFTMDLSHGFEWSSQINFQKGVEELDDGSTSPSRHAAPTFGNTKLSYRYKQLNMQLYAVFNDEVSYDELPESEKSKDYMYATDENGNPYSPAWYTLNYKVMYTFENKFTISGGVENLTDIRYRPYSSGLVAPGRNFILSLRANF